MRWIPLTRIRSLCFRVKFHNVLNQPSNVVDLYGVGSDGHLISIPLATVQAGGIDISGGDGITVDDSDVIAIDTARVVTTNSAQVSLRQDDR